MAHSTRLGSEFLMLSVSCLARFMRVVLGTGRSGLWSVLGATLMGRVVSTRDFHTVSSSPSSLKRSYCLPATSHSSICTLSVLGSSESESDSDSDNPTACLRRCRLLGLAAAAAATPAGLLSLIALNFHSQL